MTAKHTPGPWLAKRHSSSSDSFNVYAPDPSEHAADGDLTIVAEYLTKDNAKLIAAAPALADACESALRDWFALHYGTNDIGMAALIRDKLKAALRAAGRLP